MGTTFDVWRQRDRDEGRAQGRAEGRAEGRAQGRLEGGRRLLELCLAHRFGPLPAGVVERLAKADMSRLEAWAVRAVTVERLEDLFWDEPSWEF